MEFPVICAASHRRFPPTFLLKPEPDIPIQVFLFPILSKDINRLPSFVSKPKQSRVISPNCLELGSEDYFNYQKSNENKSWIHFVGIGGCGLSALAMLALNQGFEVSGSDIVWSSFMDGLQKAGARLYVGHSLSNIQRNNGSSLPVAVVVSSAIPPDNEEIMHAKFVGVPIYKRDYWLKLITEQHTLITVSGSHVFRRKCYFRAWRQFCLRG